MNCIFCKQNSKDSKSREHIVPESLGNKSYILPKGWVCDQCNNYISREVEGPFLNSFYGKYSRFEMAVPSKKGRIPIISGYHLQSRIKVNILDYKKDITIFPANENDNELLKKSILSNKTGSLLIPNSGIPTPSYELSRFIGKIGFELLAFRICEDEEWNQELVTNKALDELRNYVRLGKPGFIWPVNIRKIYDKEKTFSSLVSSDYQVLHEMDLLVIPDLRIANENEYYAVIAIFGIEYVINLGGPELDGYLNWLKQNDNKCFLYVDKNS